jgi:hypothetical protein
VFGALTGFFTQRILAQNIKMEQLKSSKQNLMLHLHSRMRKATTLGLEGLYYLKKGVLSETEQMVVINETIKELKLIDESVQNLGQLRENTPTDACCSLLDVLGLVEQTSTKFQLPLTHERGTSDENLWIQAEPRLLVLAFDVIFEWASLHEISPVTFAYTFHEGLLSKGNKACKLEFRFGQDSLNESFGRHLLQEVVENNYGLCIVGTDSIQILLPVRINGLQVRVA